MYDLRDPSYVPPHLRPDAAAPTAQQLLDRDVVSAGILVMLACGVAARLDPGSTEPHGFRVADAWHGLSAEGLRNAAIECALEIFGPQSPSRLHVRPEKPKAKRARAEKYPFSELQVGGSFTLEPTSPEINMNNIGVLCRYKSRSTGHSYRCKRHSNGGIEVWRER